MALKISYNFVPFPMDIWDDNIELTLGEMRLLGYLIRHLVSFGNKQVRLTDDELLNGRKLIGGGRMDQGCGIKKPDTLRISRDSLIKRGWVIMQEDLSDKARPMRYYELRIDENGQSLGVPMNGTQLPLNGSTLPENGSTLPADGTRTYIRDNTRDNTKPIADVEIDNEEYTKEFEELWEAYEKNGDKYPAFKAYKRAIKNGKKHNELVEAAKKYIKACKTGARIIKYLATWLNGRCWESVSKVEPLPQKVSVFKKFPRIASSILPDLLKMQATDEQLLFLNKNWSEYMGKFKECDGIHHWWGVVKEGFYSSKKSNTQY